MRFPEEFLSRKGQPMTALVGEVVTDGRNRPQLKLQGEIDILTVPVLDDMLSELVLDNYGDVVVDLARVEFIGVAGVKALCRHAGHVRERGDRLMLSSPSAVTQRVIDVVDVAENLVLSGQEARPSSRGTLAVPTSRQG